MCQRSLLLLVVVVTWAGWAGGQTSQYCSFTPKHTMCKYSSVGPRCGSKVQTRGVGPREAADIVHQHNQLRSRVAMGQERRGVPGPQPKAANMKLMVWDKELAEVAQRHADQCLFKHDCADCRRVSRFSVGQNIFVSYQSNYDTSIQWDRALKSWYDEVALFSPTNIQPFKFTSALGHYTQMVWFSTDRVGCGYTMYQEGGWWKKLYTCNYGPGGNIILDRMYTRGTPCSSCPTDTSCSSKYPGLCSPGFVPSVSNHVLPQRPRRPTVFPTNSFAHANTNQNAKKLDARSLPQESEGQEAMFIPFNGTQPTTSDLMPYLRRAGLDAQIIRTSSLASVQGIISALPKDHIPIVLYRSGTGELTELDAQTLQPVQSEGSSITSQVPSRDRVSRSITSEGPSKDHQTLLTCNLGWSPCEVIRMDGNWTVAENKSEGVYTEVLLEEEGESAQLLVETLVVAPSTEAVCVALTHRLSLAPYTPSRAAVPDLQIGVMPLGGEVRQKTVLGTPGLWQVSRVTMSNLKTSFLLVITVGPASHPATVALDAVVVTDGMCCSSSQC
nr:uncharacterized protein LOC128686406 isoform X2 [Cherax quadricarinatus]